MSDSNLEVTSALQWKRPDERVQLPSGKVAMLRRPSPISLMSEQGHIPDALMDSAFSAMQKGQVEVRQETVKNDFQTLLQLAILFCKAAFVSPCIKDQPVYENGEIAISDLDNEDMFFVMGWAMGGENGSQMVSFPQKQDGDVAPIRNGKRFRGKTKRTVRD